MQTPEPVSIRALLGEVLDVLEVKPSARQLRDAERMLIKGLAEMLVADGYTLRMAGDCLGVVESTLTSWKSKDPAWRERLESRRQETSRWLIAHLRLQIEEGGKAAGRAMDILARLWLQELRETKVTVDKVRVPTPGESRAAVLKMVE